MQPTSNPSANARIAPTRRRPRRIVALALAGLVGTGALALAYTDATVSARAESATTAQARVPASFADLVENVRGAVVSISVTNGAKVSRRDGGNPFPGIPEDHPLYEFFKRFGGENNRGMPQPRPSQAQGSGFIISPDGYVVTNNHVIDDASEIKVSIDDKEEYDAELVGTDARTDLALLRIKADKEFHYVEFSDKPARVGDWVVALGNPFGLGGTVTAGIVSAHGRAIGSGPYDYIQIDAAVNRGNSGGPTFNLEGNVVGVNTAIFSPSGGNVGIAFAVPGKLAASVVAELKESGSVSRGWLGVHIQSINRDIAMSLDMDEPHGALISKITEDGPASKHDLRVGDAIVEVNGQRIEDSRDLARKVAQLRPDAVADITVLRDGRRMSVDVELGRFPDSEELASLQQDAPSAPDEELKDLGLSLAPASRTGDQDQPGVVVTQIDPSSEAARKGLRRGDIILDVGGTQVDTPDQVARKIREVRESGRGAVLLRVQSGEEQRFVAVPIKTG